jgi:hypothetical protein
MSYEFGILFVFCFSSMHLVATHPEKQEKRCTQSSKPYFNEKPCILKNRP